MIVYCHEYLSDRWSFHPYVDHLRDLGYDIFTFDFRNHGASDRDPGYAPLQWTTDHEVRDLRAALAYLRTRARSRSGRFRALRRQPGRDDGAARRPPTSPTSGASSPTARFPTRGTMVPYILRWAEIYVRSRSCCERLIPIWLYSFLAWAGRRTVGAAAELPLPRAWKRRSPGWPLGPG